MSPYEKECRLALLKAVYITTRLSSSPAKEISTTYKEAKEVFTLTDETVVFHSIQHAKEKSCRLWE
jgi:hypothetical protein